MIHAHHTSCKQGDLHVKTLITSCPNITHLAMTKYPPTVYTDDLHPSTYCKYTVHVTNPDSHRFNTDPLLKLPPCYNYILWLCGDSP